MIFSSGEYYIFYQKRKTKQQVKGDYESYNRTTDYLGVESFKNDTALFSLTKIYSFFCDFAFLLTKEQNSKFIRAPPFILKTNILKMNGGLFFEDFLY